MSDVKCQFSNVTYQISYINFQVPSLRYYMAHVSYPKGSHLEVSNANSQHRAPAASHLPPLSRSVWMEHTVYYFKKCIWTSSERPQISWRQRTWWWSSFPLPMCISTVIETAIDSNIKFVLWIIKCPTILMSLETRKSKSKVKNCWLTDFGCC